MVDTENTNRQILLPYTQLDWSSSNGDVPVSPVFDDVYFSVENGVAESYQHFIVGNDLLARFTALPEHAHFTVLETGFGSGLNFILTADLFLKHAPKTAHLHFVSVEGYPLSPSDMAKILQLALCSDGAHGGANGRTGDFNIDTSLIEDLLSAYPAPCRGFHRCHLGGGHLGGKKSRIDLTLYMGHMDDFVPALHSYDCGIVDAVFLDGFAPAKNPDMWQDALFKRLPDLMKTGGTLATFTSAGFVRRALTDVGFTMSKTQGYGRKRERLIGVYKHGKPNPIPPKKIAVIGAGIAGLTIAQACRQWGADVTVFDVHAKPMGGASGNPVGLIEPRLLNDNDTTYHGRLNRAAYLYSVAYYDHLHALWKKPIWSCKGLALCPKKDFEQNRLKKILKNAPLPPEHLHEISYDEIVKIAGCDVFPHAKDEAKNATKKDTQNNQNSIAYFPQTGGVYPHHICDCLSPQICLKNNAKITAVERDQNTWILTLNNREKTAPYDKVIVCAGVDSLTIDGIAKTTQNHGDILRPNRGQISWVDAPKSPPKIAIGGGGYTAYNAMDNTVVFGATWDKISHDQYSQNEWQKITPNHHSENVKKVSDLLPQLSEISLAKMHGRVAIRATVPDRMPLLGEITDGVFLATGYGARGLQYAPYLSQLCLNLLWKVFPPCDSQMVNHIHPNRHLCKTTK